MLNQRGQQSTERRTRSKSPAGANTTAVRLTGSEARMHLSPIARTRAGNYELRSRPISISAQA
jgi:hypothetical protein